MTAPEELRHLVQGPRHGERPAGAGLVTLMVSSGGNAAAVVSRARELMRVVLEQGGPPWPPLVEWHRLLPDWFVAACSPERSQEEEEAWVRWWRSLPPSEKTRAARERRWSLADWLFWMEPSERQWFWWDASVENSAKARVVVGVPGWPTGLGALEWLLRAAGATEVDVLGDAPATT